MLTFGIRSERRNILFVRSYDKSKLFRFEPATSIRSFMPRTGSIFPRRVIPDTRAKLSRTKTKMPDEGAPKSKMIYDNELTPFSFKTTFSFLDYIG